MVLVPIKLSGTLPRFNYGVCTKILFLTLLTLLTLLTYINCVKKLVIFTGICGSELSGRNFFISHTIGIMDFKLTGTLQMIKY